MTSIPQNPQLLKNLFYLLEAHRPLFKQYRVYQRIQALVLAAVFGFGRMTLRQMIMSLGGGGEDWSAWYRLFSQERFDADRATEVLLEEVLKEFRADELILVGGDGTQTPRTSRKIV